MPGQENARKYGVGQSAGSLGKLKGIIRKYEGICEKKNIKNPRGWWDHWLGVWKSC